MLATEAWKSRPIAGSAIPTTVASSAAMPDPSTVAVSTQRPVRLPYRRPCVVSVTISPVFPTASGLAQPSRQRVALGDHGRGQCPAALAQVVPDLAAKPPRLPPVTHG